MAGRRPKPTRLKEISGNPGKRLLNESEPSPLPEIPECPAHLDDEARAEWDRVAPRLHALRIMARIYRGPLAAYCVAWSRWVNAETELRNLSPVIKTEKGYPIQNPYLAIANTAMDQMRKFSIEFGFTPSSKSRVSAGGSPSHPSGKKDDPWQEFEAKPTVN